MTNKPRNRIFRFLYKFHIYSGLFSSVFFIIIGITSLKYNHPGLFKKEHFREKSYLQPFSFHSGVDSLIIERALDTLGIFGHKPWWLQGRDKEENFYFHVIRPGKEYTVTVLEKERQLMVKEKSLGIMHALSGMHVASTGNPKSMVFGIWSVYAHIAVIAGLFSLILSIYFWLRKSKLTRRGWIFTVSLFVLSILFILYIWLVG